VDRECPSNWRKCFFSATCSAISSTRTSSLVAPSSPRIQSVSVSPPPGGGDALPGLKGSRSVLEELLLPAVEHCRPQAQFLTQIRDGHLVQKVPPQNGYLLFCCVMLPFLFIRSLRDFSGGTPSSLPTEPGQKSFIEHPGAILFPRIARGGVFQQPRLRQLRMALLRCLPRPDPNPSPHQILLPRPRGPDFPEFVANKLRFICKPLPHRR
jgi:hypothetical protein